MKKTLVVGLVQCDVVTGDVEANLTRVFHGLMTLAEAGAELAVLPEMWSCGFDNAHLKEMAEKTPEIMERIAAFAARERMAVAGSLPELVKEGVSNTLFFADTDGSLKEGYRKVHLFTPTGEDDHFVAGDKPKVIETSLGTLGPMICYDLRFPELARTHAVGGAEVLLVSAQWPKARVAHWESLLVARAIENQCFVVGVNRVGRSGELEFSGASQVISPTGEVLAHAGNADGEVVVELKREALEAFRDQVPCLEERRPMCYF